MSETYAQWQARWDLVIAAAQRQPSGQQARAAVRQAVRDMQAEAMRLWPEGNV